MFAGKLDVMSRAGTTVMYNFESKILCITFYMSISNLVYLTFNINI